MALISKDKVISDARDAVIEVSGDSTPITYGGETGLAARIRNLSGGGGMPFIATYTNTAIEEEEPIFSCDKTYQEISSAIISGQQVIARVVESNIAIYLVLEAFMPNLATIQFSGTVYTETSEDSGNFVEYLIFRHYIDMNDEEEKITGYGWKITLEEL